VVLKLDDLRLQRLLGQGRTDPDWAIALKFPAQVTRGLKRDHHPRRYLLDGSSPTGS